MTLSTVETPHEILMALKPCHWRYKPEEQTGLALGNKINFGFIAQDLLDTFGDRYNFVDSDADYLRVNYMQFIGILTSVVQSQQEQIRQLQEEIQHIKGV